MYYVCGFVIKAMIICSSQMHGCFGFRTRADILVIPGIVGIDHVHCQSKLTTINHGAYAVDTLKLEIEAVKVEK